jgi:hypothetical protein
MTNIPCEDQTFRVLQVVPNTPYSNEDEVVAKLDLIHTDYKLLLFDCELHLVDGDDAYVKVPDLRVLLRYYLEPGFCGEIDWEELLDQMSVAVCKYFGLPTESVRTSGEVLDEFLRGPRWPDWIRANQIVPSELEAVVDFADAAFS